MEAKDGMSSETIVWLFYKHKTTDYKLLWDKAQSDHKDHELKAVTWKNHGKSVDLPVMCKNTQCIFLNFVLGFGSYVKGLL